MPPSRLQLVVAAAAASAGLAAADWKLVVRQTGPAAEGTPPTWTRKGTSEADPNYSILDSLEPCRSGGGFAFKTYYPKGDKTRPAPFHNIWFQTSNPLTTPFE
eukprot:SAG22_NODE_9004_length_615_cov_0.908915_1_plen_102_part_10